MFDAAIWILPLPRVARTLCLSVVFVVGVVNTGIINTSAILGFVGFVGFVVFFGIVGIVDVIGGGIA